MHTDFPFTFGIEEEFFVAQRRNRNVAAQVPRRFIERAKRDLGEHVVSHELLQCQVELVSPILSSHEEARRHVTHSRSRLGAIAESMGLSLISSGTHPLAAWVDQEITNDPRYDEMLRGFQIVGRRNLFCGLHVHVEVPEGVDRVQVMNRAMRWLPLFLAFSTSSPFWNRHHTGLLSYRQAAYDEWPRSGIPDHFQNQAEYDAFADCLVRSGAMKDSSFLWWAIRPSLRYPTLELRIADACTHFEDSLALVALYRAMIAFLVRNPDYGREWTPITRRIVDENRWRAKRYGTQAEFIDDITGTVTPIASWFRDLCGLISRDAERLGSTDAIRRLGYVLRSGTSAHRQIDIYHARKAEGGTRREALNEVVDWLAQETLAGTRTEAPQAQYS